MNADAEVFLSSWFENCSGLIEIRHQRHVGDELGPMKTAFLNSPEAASDYVQFVQNEEPRQDIYFGVATRREIDGKIKGTKRHCWEVPGLWMDLDPKDGVVDDAEVVNTEPTFCIDSGRGRHFYWKFNDPLTAESADWVEDACRGLAAKYGADLAVCDVARIMRLPGTVNQKPDGGKCWIVSGDGNHSPKSRFLTLAASGQLQRSHQKNHDTAPGDKTTHTDGGRNHGLKTRLAELMYLGLGVEETMAAGEAWNQERCDPPLEPREVESFRPFLEQGDWRTSETVEDEKRAERQKDVLIAGEVGSVSFLSQIERDCPPPKMIVPRLLPEGATIILAAPGGAGKGWFMLQLMAHLATGQSWGPLEIGKPRPCLFVDFEDGTDMLSWRTSQVVRQMCPDGLNDWQSGMLGGHARQLSIGGAGLKWHTGLAEQLLVEIEAMGSSVPGVVWVDTLAKSLPDKMENNDTVAVSSVMDELTATVEATGWSVGLSGHVPKAGMKGGIDAITVMGSVGWVNSARVTWLAMQVPPDDVKSDFPALEGQRVIRLRVDKANWFMAGADMFLKQVPETEPATAGTLEWVSDEERLNGADAVENSLKRWLGDRPEGVVSDDLERELTKLLKKRGMSYGDKARRALMKVYSDLDSGWIGRKRAGQHGPMRFGMASPEFSDSEF